MAEKTLNSRIIHKHDTAEHWSLATNFTPKQGEIIVYDIDDTYNYERIKIGDGVQNVNDLPFVQDAAHTHNNVTTTTSGFMSATDKNKLDTYIDASGTNTKFVGKNNGAILQGGTINISAEQNLNGARIYQTGKPASGSFFVRPNEQGNPISIGHEKTYLSIREEYSNSDVIVRGIASPTSDNDAVNKTYVDGAVADVSALIGDTPVSQQISNATAQIDYPVDSVNGKTGAVQLAASDVGALPDTTEIPVQNVFTARTDGNNRTIVAASDGFTYTVGNILVLTFEKEITDNASRTINVNGLGAKSFYNTSTSSTFTSLYAYTKTINAGDVLVLMYDKYDHFVLLEHNNAAIGDAQLEMTVRERLLPTASAYTTGSFLRISDDGEWEPYMLNIPSVEGLATEDYVDEAVAAMVDSAPETLNTLNELAAALGDDPNFATTVATQIGALESKVGDTSVSEQISAANMIYVGPDRPSDPNIKVWINTSEEGTGVIPVLPRVATITLVAASWTGDSTPYSQTVSINTVTAATKIDLQPTVAQITSLQNDDIALMAENTNGVVTIYSFGGKPSGDMTMQVLLTEVSYV